PEAERRRRTHVVVLARADVHRALDAGAALFEKFPPMTRLGLVATAVLGGDRQIGPHAEARDRALEQIAVDVRQDREPASAVAQRQQRGGNLGEWLPVGEGARKR